MAESDYRRIVRRMERVKAEPGSPEPLDVLRNSALLAMILNHVRACGPEDVEAALSGGLLALAACVESATTALVNASAMECPDPDAHERPANRCGDSPGALPGCLLALGHGGPCSRGV